MKKHLTAFLSIGSLLLAFSASASTTYVEAPVIDKTPIFETVRVPTSREVCWDEEVYHERRRGNAGGVILGGIIGGVLGNQIGSGSGRRVATAAGLVTGAVVANNMSKRHHDGRVVASVEQRCRTANEYFEEERVVGYRVRYELNGRTYSTRMDEDPGEFVQVRIDVTPVR